MIDEALDTITHDMAYSNYDEQTVSGVDQVVQNIKIRLLMIAGEFFGDSTLGNINFQDLATKNNIPAIVDAANKVTIKDTPEVVSITSYTSVFNPTKRTMEISFKVQTIYGQATVNNMAVSI